MIDETRPQRASRSLARSLTQIMLARELRQKATEAEKVAWQLLRILRLKGFRFRRQHPVGKCVADFCCQEKRLIVELDGRVHAQPSQMRRDARRDQYLERLGYTVLRLPNGIVLDAPDEFTRRVLGCVLLPPRVFTGEF
jgi:very-short-patch-repair endonuclease